VPLKIRTILAPAFLLASAAPNIASAAQSYPDKPVRVLVGIAPGGGTDSVARLLTQRLTDTLGQSFVVDNRPGAGGNVATELAAHATADGYTLLFVSPTFIVNPSLWRNVTYDAIRDFAPIVQVASFQYVLSVRSSVPAHSVKELIALARTQPLAYASTGIGSANHLAGELFKSMAGVNLIHVPYKGSAPAVSALLAGEVQAMFSSSSGVIPHVKTGRIRALAVTGPARTAVAPNIPTVAESGLAGFDVTGWYGMLAPARVPGATIAKLNETVNRLLPELRERYASLGNDTVGGTPAEFAAFLRIELNKWSKVVKLSGAKVD